METRISVFGLGYVGTISAACLAQQGHHVIGVDISTEKLDIIRSGKSPVIEEQINDIVADVVRSGCLRVTTSAAEAVSGSDVSLVCVGTPSNHNGSIDLTFVNRVVADIGSSLARKKTFHTVILRSTVLPGTTEACVIPTLEHSSGRVAGRDFGVCYNPEFLREGTSVHDFHHPPVTVIGEFDALGSHVASSLYGALDAPLVTVPVKTAEMIKYANNAFHALKVTFANEIANICKSQGIDGHRVMELFCLDTKLNISPYYLKPGFAFGGSCLPKDLRALLYHSHHLDLRLPVLESILVSNELQISQAVEMVKQKGHKKVGVFGLSFKSGTDDLRESPLVVLVEALIGKGFDVRIYDKHVSLARLQGSNRAYIEREIPHISKLMCESPDGILDHADVLIVGAKSPELSRVLTRLRPGQSVIDLVRLSDVPRLEAAYEGVCW